MQRGLRDSSTPLWRGKRTHTLIALSIALICAAAVGALIFSRVAAQGRDLREDNDLTNVSPPGPGDLRDLTLPRTPQKYPRLDSILSQLVADYEAGQRSAQDASSQAPSGNQTGIAVTVYTDGDTAALSQWLESNGGDPRNVGQTYIEAYVPVGLLGPLSQQPGVSRVRTIIPPVALRAPVMDRDLLRESRAGSTPAAGTGASASTAPAPPPTPVPPPIDCGE